MVATVLLAVVIASSQGPAPRPVEVSSPPQQAAAEKQQPATNRAAPAKPSPAPTTQVCAAQDGQHAAGQPHTQQNPESAITRSIAKYTLWLVIVGALQVVAMAVQACFLVMTLKATTKAANATTAAAKAAQEQVSHMGDQTPAVKASADAAKKSAEATGQMLDAMDRAWLSVKVEFDRWAIQADKSLAFWYNMTIENIGASVANNVQFRTGTVLLSRGEQHAAAEWVAAQDALPAYSDDRFMLFPRDPQRFLLFNRIEESDYIEHAAVQPDGKSLLRPLFLCVVSYKYPTSDRLHRTRLAYTIQRKIDPSGAVSFVADPALREELTAGNVWFAQSTSGGNEAD